MKTEYLPCPICINGIQKPRYQVLGLRYHLKEFHKRVDIEDLIKLARKLNKKWKVK